MCNQFIRIVGSIGALSSWLLVFACTNPSRADVNLFISEVMAANRRTLADQDGEFSDWVEIYNPSASPVNLEGWFLTDNPKVLTKWRIPAARLRGNGFLVVFASQKTQRGHEKEFHANFKLDPGGEFLALVKPDGTNISFQFAPAYPPQVSDVSYGIDAATLKEALVANPTDGTTAPLNISTNSFRYFATPTPGAANNEGVRQLAAAPKFSKPSGVYLNNCAVEVNASGADATIRFTTDGTEPTKSSQAYSGPINLSVTTLVKARVFVPGQAPSPTVAQTYTIADESVAQSSSNLPLVVMDIVGRSGINSETWTPATLRFVDAPEGKRALLTGAANFDGEGRVHYRGYTSLRHPKKSYAVKTTDSSGESLKTSLLGMPPDSDWILYAPWPDKAMIRDVLAYELSNRMENWAPHTKFVELYVSRTGSRLSQSAYVGVYVLEEKIKRAKARVDIAELGPSDNSEPNISGGYILKKDHSDKHEPSFTSSQGIQFFYVEPKPEDITQEQREWIRRYVNRLERAVDGSNFRDPTRGYRAFLDPDSFIDYFWLVEMSKNIDGFRFSTFFTLDRGGKMKMYPAWDWNLSFGNAQGRAGYNPQGWYHDTLDDQQYSWYRRLFQDPDFEQRRIDRWAELRREIFAPEKLLRRVDELAALLNEAQERNYQKWPILGQRIMPNYQTFGSYAEEVNYMKTWIRNRISWIDRQIPATPVASRNGNNVAIRASQGTVFYTLDGSDPRASGGAASPKAQTYASPVNLPSGKKLIARAQVNGAWTPPAVVVSDSSSGE